MNRSDLELWRNSLVMPAPHPIAITYFKISVFFEGTVICSTYFSVLRLSLSRFKIYGYFLLEESCLMDQFWNLITFSLCQQYNHYYMHHSASSLSDKSKCSSYSASIADLFIYVLSRHCLHLPQTETPSFQRRVTSHLTNLPWLLSLLTCSVLICQLFLLF